MSTLRQFSEKEQNYHLYQARQNFLREQRTIQWEFEQSLEQERELKLAAMKREMAALQEKDAAIQEKDAAMQEKDAATQREMAALQEIAHLKALLAKP